jgi:hypothetical protein
MAFRASACGTRSSENRKRVMDSGAGRNGQIDGRAQHAHCCLLRHESSMRGQGHIFHRQQRIVGGRRLLLKNVHRGMTDVAGVQQRRERIGVDDGGARSIDQNHTGLGHGQSGMVQEAASLLVQGER